MAGSGDGGILVRVLVTGAAGFIGSHTVRALAAAGHEVHGLDRVPASPLRPLPPGVPLHRVDITGGDLARIIAQLRPEAVVHLAAQTRVAESIRDPGADFEVNVAATVRLVQAAAAAGCRRIVFASSAAVYGVPAALPVPEDAPCRPLSAYGLHKLLAEQYLVHWGRMAGLEVVALRYANVYGPGQEAGLEGGVVAVFLERLRRGEPLPIHGDGLQTRDFVYVEDVARANLQALTAPVKAAVLNVGTGTRISVRDLATIAARVLGVGEPRLEFHPPRTGDIRDSALDPSAAERVLGWQAQVSLAEGLGRCLAVA